MCKPSTLKWIFDCRATDTMTNDPDDLKITPTPRSKIQTANGECVDITKSGTVEISSSIHLRNCLLFPNLTHKLLFVSQLTKELDCTVLIQSDGCVVQDALAGTIIGRGIERGGLYYVDETTQNGQAMLTCGSPDHQLWMWHVIWVIPL